MLKIYYGMCGCFKYTTLSSESKSIDTKILSLVKPYLTLSLDLTGKTPSDLDFALARLLQYSEVTDYTKDVYVERGLTDFLESWTSDPVHSYQRFSDNFITPWLEKESEFVSKFNDVERDLFVMNDEKFITDVILKEPSRRRRYPNLSDYLKRQKEYIEFTKKWNKIDREIIIDNANQYLENLKK